jgi:CheY-like chemotaxis protein
MAAHRVVLVIEDDRNFSRILEAKLLKNSYSVRTAPDALSALACLLERPVHVALLDGRLPDADGLAALPLLRSAAPRTPFVFMTAYEEEYPRSRAISAGAAVILYKPFDLDTLTSEVARLASLGERPAARTMENAAVAARPADGVVAIIEDPAEATAQPDRRAHPRCQVCCPVVLTPTKDPGGNVSRTAVFGMSLDVSLGGAALVTPRPMEVGADARVQCTLPHGRGPVLDAEASVVRVEVIEGPPPLVLYRMAVRFKTEPPVSAGIIEGFVAAAREN